MKTRKIAEFRTFSELLHWHRARRIAKTRHTSPLPDRGLQRRPKLQTR
jgi:hypothetical protein